MALIVTPGAGNADAFVEVADVTAYAAAHGLTWVATTSVAEPAIRRATIALSTGFHWKGYRTSGRAQSLAWPRTDVEDAEGETVNPDSIPAEIFAACCEMAVYEQASPGGLSPTVILTDRVKRERIGQIETEYASSAMTAEAARPILTRVNDLISGLLAGSNNPLVGTAARW
jgi:hypothetical protein